MDSHVHHEEPLSPHSMTTSRISTQPGNSPFSQIHEEPLRPLLSKRVQQTEPAHIEVVLSKYSGMTPRPANLAQGVAYWNPPEEALRLMRESKGLENQSLQGSDTHRYGPALGLPALREALSRKLERENGLDMTGQEVGIWEPPTCGPHVQGVMEIDPDVLLGTLKGVALTHIHALSPNFM